MTIPDRWRVQEVNSHSIYQWINRSNGSISPVSFYLTLGMRIKIQRKGRTIVSREAWVKFQFQFQEIDNSTYNLANHQQSFGMQISALRVFIAVSLASNLYLVFAVPSRAHLSPRKSCGDVVNCNGKPTHLSIIQILINTGVCCQKLENCCGSPGHCQLSNCLWIMIDYTIAWRKVYEFGAIW